MLTVQQYLNPLYSATKEPTPINYGWHSLTHLSTKAATIQNTALRILSCSLAFLFDATIGFGLLETVSYNGFVFLHNRYAALCHHYQKYQGKTDPTWNPTALKTWAVLGIMSASLFGLYFFKTHATWKNEIRVPVTQMQTAPATNLTSPTTLLPYLQAILLLQIGSVIASTASYFAERKRQSHREQSIALIQQQLDAISKSPMTSPASTRLTSFSNPSTSGSYSSPASVPFSSNPSTFGQLSSLSFQALHRDASSTPQSSSSGNPYQTPTS